MELSAGGAGSRKAEVGEIFQPLGLEHPFSFEHRLSYTKDVEQQSSASDHTK